MIKEKKQLKKYREKTKSTPLTYYIGYEIKITP
jgi:hypothetical protein